MSLHLQHNINIAYITEMKVIPFKYLIKEFRRPMNKKVLNAVKKGVEKPVEKCIRNKFHTNFLLKLTKNRRKILR